MPFRIKKLMQFRLSTAILFVVVSFLVFYAALKMVERLDHCSKCPTPSTEVTVTPDESPTPSPSVSTDVCPRCTGNAVDLEFGCLGDTSSSHVIVSDLKFVDKLDDFFIDPWTEVCGTLRATQPNVTTVELPILFCIGMSDVKSIACVDDHYATAAHLLNNYVQLTTTIAIPTDRDVSFSVMIRYS